MDLYGRTPREIYRLLSWQHKLIFVAGAIYIVFAVFYLLWLTIPKPPQKPAPVTIVYEGNPAILTAFDPSLATDGDTTYIATTTLSAWDNTELNPVSEIFVGRMQQRCRSILFTPASNPIPVTIDDLYDPRGNVIARGFWRNEGPALVYDPDDTGREWKIFAYKYFWHGDAETARKYNVIVMSTTSDPLTGTWSREEWVLGHAAQNTPMPYRNFVRQYVSELIPAADAGIRYYARPSVVYTNGVMIMSLTGYTGQQARSGDNIVMLISNDHGKSWHGLGVALTIADVRKTGVYTKLTGGTLVLQDQEVFLAAVLGNDTSDALGTFIIPFDDILKARILRDAAGAPFIQNHIGLSSQSPTLRGGGFATYSPGCDNMGVVTSEFSGMTSRFEIFGTQIKPRGLH